MVIEHITLLRPEIAELIGELDRYLLERYPRDHCHFTGLEDLLAKGSLVVARNDNTLVGCGAVLNRGGFFELKRFYVREVHRRKGVAGAILKHLEDHVLRKNVNMIRLETGVFQPESIGFYESKGYRRRKAFEPYSDERDCYSVFMEKSLNESCLP